MTIHLLIQGKVQGVYYRQSAKDVAEQLNITGWIRNTKDGDVEAVITGDEDLVKEFIEWCKKGPGRAKVEKVTETKKEDEQFTGFEIKR